ncbi:MAG: pirin-like C-terminal cupin domain-containing protein, partial [Burkholderiaceae bacterium]
LHEERAAYLAEGTVEIGGETFEPRRLIVFKPHAGLMITAKTAARLILLGGEPMDGARYLSWNFVSSSAERIEQAKDDWRAQRFARVPGESGFIPLPELPGSPVRYP